MGRKFPSSEVSVRCAWVDDTSNHFIARYLNIIDERVWEINFPSTCVRKEVPTADGTVVAARYQMIPNQKQVFNVAEMPRQMNGLALRIQNIENNNMKFGRFGNRGRLVHSSHISIRDGRYIPNSSSQFLSCIHASDSLPILGWLYQYDMPILGSCYDILALWMKVNCPYRNRASIILDGTERILR